MVEETKDVEQSSETQEEVTSEIYDESFMEESETSSESSTETTDDQESEESSAEDVKSESEDTDDGETKTGDKPEVKEGDPIPFHRFKEVNDAKNALEDDLAEVKSLLKDPKIMRSIMEAQGYTEDKIKESFTQNELEYQGKSLDNATLIGKYGEGLDLEKQEGWVQLMQRIAKETMQPLQSKLSQREQQDLLAKEETEAKTLAEETYKLDYGKPRQDENNPNTAIGKMSGYLKTHPEDAGLGYAKILKLAMAEESLGLGKEQGVKQEKKRHKDLKNAAMEGDVTTSPDEEPNEDSSIQTLMNWSRKHNK